MKSGLFLNKEMIQKSKFGNLIKNGKLELTELKARDASCPKGKKMSGERTIKIRTYKEKKCLKMNT